MATSSLQVPAAADRPLDAKPGLIDRLPARLQAYLRLMRLDRPIGIWLLFIPCLWGVLAAGPDALDAYRFWSLIVLFALGSVVMRSAGCAYNDVVDRDLDRQVARTRARPLASGALGRKEGAALVVGLSLIGLLVLLQLGRAAILLGLATLFLVAAYPFAKRITWWPQVWLGLTFNWGILIAVAAVLGHVPLHALLIYLGAVFWTLGYDTIYALQDVEDDALAGIKSSARRLGKHARLGVAGAYFTALVLFIAAHQTAGGSGPGLLLLALPALHFAAQVLALEPGNADRNLSVFKSNIGAGLAVSLALLAW